MVNAILFDVIGTTVLEKGGDVVMGCLQGAFADHGVEIDIPSLISQRGKAKREMIAFALQQQHRSLQLVDPVYADFVRRFKQNLDAFTAAEGAREIFGLLRSRGIRIGLGTGLDRDIFTQLLLHLNWRVTDFDYTGTCSDVPNARPHPDMIRDMQQKLSVFDRDSFLKVGDTVADIQEGKHAGVKTAVILSGTQDEKLLKHENPDFVFARLFDIKVFIEQL